MKIISQVKKHIESFFVNGTIGKVYNIVSYKGYMKNKTRYLKKRGVKINDPVTYISPDVYFDGHDYSLISIGKNVVLSREVMLLVHDYSIGGLMKAFEIKFDGEGENIQHFKEEIIIGDDTFIGARASILPGIKIGKCCIIGACSVVKGNIPDYSIVVGNPAKIINDTRKFVEKSIKGGN